MTAKKSFIIIEAADCITVIFNISNKIYAYYLHVLTTLSFPS